MVRRKSPLMFSQFFVNLQVILNHFGYFPNCFVFIHKDNDIKPVFKHNERGAAHG